jgi:DNA-binding SARP family transcriptional activator/TolB-like protein
MALYIGVLGTLALRDDSGPIARIASPYGRVVLGYVARSPGIAVPREALAGLLWPQNQDARHRLRHAIMQLRRSLERAAPHLAVSRESLCLQDAAADWQRFERLCQSPDRIDLRTAAALYRGAFLADTTLPSAACDEWVTLERNHFHNLAAGLLDRLALAESAAGDHDAAFDAAARLLALEPLSDPAMRTAMKAHAAAGKRAQTLRLYRDFRDRMLAELKVEPEAATRELARDINRSLFPVVAPGIAADKMRWPFELPRLSVAVQPLDNHTGKAGNDYLAEGLTDDLVTDLVRSGRGLAVDRITDGRQRYARLPGPADADYVVRGSAQRGAGRNLRINVQIIDTVTSEYCWAGRFESSPAELPATQVRITREVARQLHFLLIGAAGRRMLPGLSDALAPQEYFLRGMDTMRGPDAPGTTAEAQRLFLSALALEPRHAGALSGFAVTCQHIASQPWWSGSDVRETAIAVGMGAAASALELEPNHYYANLGQGMLCSATGRLEEAAEALDRARSADPFFGGIRAFAAYNGAFLGRAHETLPAIEEAERFERLDRRIGFASFYAGFAELLLGRHEAAVGYLAKALERSPGHGGANLFLVAARAMDSNRAPARMAADFRARYPQYRQTTFSQQWLGRSAHPVYQAQIEPVFEKIQALGLLS